jgi:hypothetical protein
MKRTSLTHPLQIAVVSAGPDFGRVGITFCPGKYDRHAMTGEWVRDLSLDLDRVRDWGAAAVVTLLEPKELASSTLVLCWIGKSAGLAPLKPASFSPLRKAFIRRSLIPTSENNKPAPRIPITLRGSSARDGDTHAAAPLRRVMNSRRLMGLPLNAEDYTLPHRQMLGDDLAVHCGSRSWSHIDHSALMMRTTFDRFFRPGRGRRSIVTRAIACGHQAQRHLRQLAKSRSLSNSEFILTAFW